MDEATLGAWQHALVHALVHAHTAAEVRALLRAALPDHGARIDALDDRALAVAIDLLQRWSPHATPRERG